MKRSKESVAVYMTLMGMKASGLIDEDAAERLDQIMEEAFTALEARLSKMEEAAHLAIDDIRDALQDSEYSEEVRIMTALDLCQEAREALA